MKVTNIDILSDNPDNAINLSFKDPTNQNSYIAKEILGLDAEEIVPKFYGTDLSGSKYFDLSLKKRSIIVKMALNPKFSENKTFSDLRDDVYKLIASSRTGVVKLLFKNGLVTKAAISGFIIKAEAPTFTSSPEVHLTIDCGDSKLQAIDQVDIDVTGLDTSNTIITDNESTSPHGFRFAVRFSGSTDSFSIKDADDPAWVFEVNLTGSSSVEFVDGDILYFSSENTNKYLYIARSTFPTHLIDRILPNSIWPIIFPGENTFVCSDLVTWEYIKHFPTYWGV